MVVGLPVTSCYLTPTCCHQLKVNCTPLRNLRIHGNDRELAGVNRSSLKGPLCQRGLGNYTCSVRRHANEIICNPDMSRMLGACTLNGVTPENYSVESWMAMENRRWQVDCLKCMLHSVFREGEERWTPERRSRDSWGENHQQQDV